MNGQEVPVCDSHATATSLPLTSPLQYCVTAEASVQRRAHTHRDRPQRQCTGLRPDPEARRPAGRCGATTARTDHCCTRRCVSRLSRTLAFFCVMPVPNRPHVRRSAVPRERRGRFRPATAGRFAYKIHRDPCTLPLTYRRQPHTHVHSALRLH